MSTVVTAEKKTEKIIQILVNIVAGLSMFYYFYQIDQPFNNEGIIHGGILVIFVIKFIMDFLTFKIGFASFSLLLLFLPIISILGFAPIGEVQALFNDPTQLIEKHFYILAFSALFFYYFWSLLLLINNKSFAKYDAKVLEYFSENRKSLLSTWIFSLVAIAASIIYLPDLPGRAYNELSPSLLPGNAWNSVVVISYFFVIIGVKESHIRKFALIFVPFWLLSHYARVDILGLILIMYLLLSNTKRGKVLKSKLNFKKVSLLVGGLLVFSYLGLVRHTGLIFDVSAIVDSFLNLINYPTVQDLIYSTAATIEVNQVYGSYYTLLNYIPQLIPSYFVAASDGAPSIVAELIHTNYGLLIYGEYYLNYQMLGVFAAPFLTYLVVFLPAFILRKFLGNFGMALAYYLIVTTIPRILWYGYIYYLKPLVVIVPVFILIYLIISAVEKELVRKPALKYK